MLKLTIIPDAHVSETCKPGTSECCSYLTIGGDGWECAKAMPGIKKSIDDQRAARSMTATGDNCRGWGIPDTIIVLNTPAEG